LAQLLINRGVDREHESFFDLRLKNLLPYHLLPNIEEGIERIIGAVKKGERIILFGDYDVDGVTGTAVLEEVLKEAGAKVTSVLPTRSSGYGLNKKLVSAFSKYGKLLITVDNGTSAAMEIDESSMDVIIIDHHNVPDEVPRKAILINPKLLDKDTELKELSSSAMCFYIGAVLRRELELDMDIRKLLDLVALGTVGDVMPMNTANRILVSKGILVLESVLRGDIKKAGVRALLQKAGIKENIGTKDIAYSLAPRLNAPGRIGDPRLSLRLLTERDRRKAAGLANEIEAINAKRKAITERVFKEAYEKAMEKRDRNFITLWGKGWHAGVLGIVAGRLSDLLGKPVAVFSEGENHSVGSVRSVPGIDIYSGLKELRDMFLKWGGHAQAVGLTLKSSLLEEFSKRADEVFAHVPKLSPPLYIDMELSPKDVCTETLEAVRKLEPLGEGNPYPTFLSEELTIEKVWERAARIGGVFMVCWDRNILAAVRSGERRRVVFSVEGNTLKLVDIEDRDGSG
ncbi:MAG TPA: single-stranded-DNA-specific exonuclease RecJ, partial [Aquificaceae bacterium]|nr:single-stranded-DNA-specific exonuclease RecJ [Aquificaceae bacterium]